jgi:transposase
MGRPPKYPAELMARGVRLARESSRSIAHIAGDVGIHPGGAAQAGPAGAGGCRAAAGSATTQEREEIRRQRREAFELRLANEILKSASVFRARARPGPAGVSMFIELHRHLGVSRSAGSSRYESIPDMAVKVCGVSTLRSTG